MIARTGFIHRRLRLGFFISAVIVAYNEEHRIRACLNSLTGVVDEIVVVHDGHCADRTLDICKLYGARVFVRPRIGEAEPHRLFSFTKAKGDWVLQIDADEALSPKLRNNIRRLVKTNKVDAYAFRWEDPEEIRILGTWPVKKYKPCLFRKNKISFKGFVHEQTGTTGRMEKSEFLLRHSPQRMSDPEVFRRKTRHWANVAARTLVTRNAAQLPRWVYLLKAPVWSALYLFLYLVVKGYILAGRNGWLMAKYHATYNFLLNYYLYKHRHV